MLSSSAGHTAVTVGFGCRRGCTREHLAVLLERALGCAGLQGQAIAGLASIDRKANEPGLLALAHQLDKPVQFFSPERLLAFTEHLSHRSASVYAQTGCYGVAEGAALALAQQLGAGQVQLLLTRQTSPLASIAIAVLVPSSSLSGLP